MRFKYSTTSPAQNEFDSLPRLSLSLRREDRIVESLGLVDSGATVNVLPYELGLQLGGVWEDRKAVIQLAGNLCNCSNRRIPTHGINIRLVKKFQCTIDFGADKLFSRIRCLLLPLYVRV
jgi:hypothetical protein